MRFGLAATVLALTFAGCGGGSSSGSSTSTTPTHRTVTLEETFEAVPPKTTPTVEAKDNTLTVVTTPAEKRKPVKPHRSAAYRTEEAICETNSPSKIAREFGIKATNPVEIAQAYTAQSYRASAAQDAFEGCLAGMRRRGVIP